MREVPQDSEQLVVDTESILKLVLTEDIFELLSVFMELDQLLLPLNIHTPLIRSLPTRLRLRPTTRSIHFHFIAERGGLLLALEAVLVGGGLLLLGVLAGGVVISSTSTVLLR